MGQGSLADKTEGYAIQVAGIAHLDATEIESQDSRILSGDILNVGALQIVILPVCDFPCMTVGQVVLMTVHDLTGIGRRKQLTSQNMVARDIVIDRPRAPATPENKQGNHNQK